MGNINTNPYLFYALSITCLSKALVRWPLKNAVGSPDHEEDASLRFVPKIVECSGVWSGRNLAAIRGLSFGLQTLEKPFKLCMTIPALSHADCEDTALTCAVVASLFAEKRSTLMPPKGLTLPK